MQAFKFNFQLSNCQLSINQKVRKAIDSVRVILNKIRLLLFTVYSAFSAHLFLAFDHFVVLLL